MKTKSFSAAKALLLSIVTGLLTAGLSVYYQVKVPSVVTYESFDAGEAHAAQPEVFVPEPAVYIPDNVSASTPQADSGGGVTFNDPLHPVRLKIESIGVDAKVQSAGITPKGTMGIPTNFTDVAWYNKGPRPGEKGNAIIAGHLDGVKVKRAVFYDLDLLKIGDEVEVLNAGGETLVFKVVDKKIFNFNDSTEEVFLGDQSKARLNLITCTGDWIATDRNYTERLVVFTELVE